MTVSANFVLTYAVLDFFTLERGTAPTVQIRELWLFIPDWTEGTRLADIISCLSGHLYSTGVGGGGGGKRTGPEKGALVGVK